MRPVTTIEFSKGHGTLNDFVLVEDVEGRLDLADTDVRFLADRRAGIGGDGVIRIVPTQLAPQDVQQLNPGTRWFMDYRNADGSAAEMCGNGTRVFAHYLRTHGLETAQSYDIATRAGTKRITVLADDSYRTDLGGWRLARGDEAEQRGMDSVVQVHGFADALPALSLDLGNPHTVVALPLKVDLDALDLAQAPHVDPHPEHGTNVEFVRALEPGHISMRVHERGVGETLSCGTGAAAAALATWWWAGRPADQTSWTVDLPGGRLGVHLDAERVALSGPAAIVATGRVTLPG
ncbi:diaminopimelate epimerase [Calidifontibacter sp. DB0510]|uniref:Diaminopimelate epimerase n=1 Tax=Metallococcus carri TaxID=1656884 RepID=A0A967B121_9MICO|nr:diaminopimelate epimerase [Metallococcus carri]NHN56092.1 diaminopimelate epimerase [Metallococcus carri]NOP37451.1 diaminopimelate epimerase [Calidifontibacter sp. DB2511S]